MAFNYVRLGKAGKGVLAVILGMISTALTILVRQSLDTPFGWLVSFALLASFIICTWQIAKQEQGKSIEEHIAKEGQLGSQAVGFGIGTATAAIIFVVTVAAF